MPWRPYTLPYTCSASPILFFTVSFSLRLSLPRSYYVGSGNKITLPASLATKQPTSMSPQPSRLSQLCYMICCAAPHTHMCRSLDEPYFLSCTCAPAMWLALTELATALPCSSPYLPQLL
eukprot:g82367.t1